MTSLWMAMPGVAAMVPGGVPAGSDKRFAGDAWRTDPRFDALSNGYLSYAKFLQGPVETAAVDDYSNHAVVQNSGFNRQWDASVSQNRAASLGRFGSLSDSDLAANKKTAARDDRQSTST